MKKARSYAVIWLIVTALIVMFVTNVLLSVFLLRKSMSTATTLVNEHMLDIANCAAEFKNDGYDSFNNVLKRADDAMYNDKSEYYKNNGGRRRSDRPQTEE
ncbi:MAG: hypothetical protein IKQ18_00160 [Clostridia bacterium]|nr:hypothetical protein [Clostridia bacterium]